MKKLTAVVTGGTRGIGLAIAESLDVVRAFEYLLDSLFVTGVTLDVNGGAFMI